MISVVTVQDHHQRCAMLHLMEERRKQQEKWGVQNHDLPTWLCILQEESGELAQEILRDKFADLDDGKGSKANLFKEAVQTAAVALQIVEFMIRQDPGMETIEVTDWIMEDLPTLTLKGNPSETHSQAIEILCGDGEGRPHHRRKFMTVAEFNALSEWSP